MLALFMTNLMDSYTTNNKYKNQGSNEKNIKSYHPYPSLFKIVATIKELTKKIKPIMKSGIFTIFAINCPKTNTTKTNLPISYNAFANSLH